MTRLLKKLNRVLNGLRLLEEMFGINPCQHGEVNKLWKQTNLTVEEVSVRMFISYEYAQKVCYGGSVGRKMRIRATKFFIEEIKRNVPTR